MWAKSQEGERKAAHERNRKTNVWERILVINGTIKNIILYRCNNLMFMAKINAWQQIIGKSGIMIHII